jgi:hydroxymethylpyrimidine pyrophosphatase-like HAD family hydrolase
MALANTYIGFDWDGTLELFELKPSLALIAFLQNLQNQGAQIFLASGKTCAALEAVSTGIVKPFLFAGESGGHIRIPSQNFEKLSAASEDLIRFAELIKSYELPPNTLPLFTKATIWCRMFGDHSLAAAKILEQVVKAHNLELDVFPHPEIDGAVDVVPHSLTKANVLKFIPMDAKIYYFGDGLNDLALLKHERVFPCTMINAHEQVKTLVKTRKGKIATQPACLGVHELLLEIFPSPPAFDAAAKHRMRGT